MNTILVINALNGSIPLVLRKKYPSAKITCAEVFPFFKQHLTKLGFEVTDWTDVGDMKFDLVIGNPPYQSTDSKRIKLWQDFLTRGYDMIGDHGYLAMVTPNSWMNQDITIAKQVRELLTGSNLVYLNKNTNEWFNVGESTCAFVVTKSLPANYNGDKIFENQDQVQHELICEKIKNKQCVTAKQVLRRLYSSPHPRENSQFKPKPTGKYSNPVVHSSTETWYTCADTSKLQGHNVIINNSGYYYHPTQGSKYLFYSATHVAGGNAFQLTFDSLEQAHNALSFLTSKLYRYFVDHTKSGGFNATALYQLPILDTGKKWTNAQVYAFFDLTPAEIALVEQEYPR